MISNIFHSPQILTCNQSCILCIAITIFITTGWQNRHARRRFARNAGAISASESSEEIETTSSLEGNAVASSSTSISHGGLSLARLAAVAGSGEGELRSSSISQTVSSRAGAAGTTGAGIADVVAVVGIASPTVVPVRKGRSNASFSLETFLGPKPGRRASCSASACAIFAKLCVSLYCQV